MPGRMEQEFACNFSARYKVPYVFKAMRFPLIIIIHPHYCSVLISEFSHVSGYLHATQAADAMKQNIQPPLNWVVLWSSFLLNAEFAR